MATPVMLTDPEGLVVRQKTEGQWSPILPAFAAAIPGNPDVCPVGDLAQNIQHQRNDGESL